MRLLRTHRLEVHRYVHNDPSSAKGYWEKGEWVEPERTTLIFGGTLMPYKEGSFKSANKDFSFSNDSVTILSDDARRGTTADLVTINGVKYEITAVEDWTVLSATRHYRAVATPVYESEGGACGAY